jgi:hypothetical protein
VIIFVAQHSYPILRIFGEDDEEFLPRLPEDPDQLAELYLPGRPEVCSSLGKL